eukprot:TRINITY_DN10304_c0_g1_i1.p1 TRINITY_DN10304_c0_g1~~TRINITY_DN10304_c0_g1_i1.p1  ORF type:complete len:229 (-),score=47.66 TRINITY_DN10304_c0_g1_i1:27-713(-)
MEQVTSESSSAPSPSSSVVGGGVGVCRVERSEQVWTGKWIGTKLVHWVDRKGKPHVWESLERTNHAKAPVDAVEIIAILKRSGQSNQLVLVRQFRPPAGSYCIELPAGLCDTSEQPEVTALRELKEETGYVGTVVDVGCSMMLGMALASTTSAVVTVTIDGDKEENINPVAELDGEEDIEVFLAPIESLKAYLEGCKEKGDVVDGKIWLIAHSLQNAELFLQPKKAQL